MLSVCDGPVSCFAPGQNAGRVTQEPDRALLLSSLWRDVPALCLRQLGQQVLLTVVTFWVLYLRTHYSSHPSQHLDLT
jgi:hypothetical protein